MSLIAQPPIPPLADVEWYLVREVFSGPINYHEGYCLGQLSFAKDGPRACYTVEDEDRHLEDGNGLKVDGTSAMPLGRFRLTPYNSPKHGTVPLFNAVPGFKYCEIHKGNDAEDLLGCVAVGEHRTIDGVSMCQPALTRVMDELRRQTMAGRAVYCNIVRREIAE